MSKDIDFTTEYTLDKSFLAECYDQTSQPTRFPHDYLKGLLFLVFGVVLLEFELLPNGYVGWFFVVLSVVEALSVFFKRTWWLWRQTFGAKPTTVKLQINVDGINYNSVKINRSIAWPEIDQIVQTDLGLILHIGKQRQYVSKSSLNDEVIAFMSKQNLKANET
ncbi:YcxB family protein [Vibrio astriarenae]